ncbi:uncharacterized protein LAJ45_02370 [Morchella importuna]|uniref:uncharacterized protein n=1 Tax=Morchella importuna TaxID=1174673 RepID=UPI001E8DF14C|nr:uncharacterized protein LAJ45_02370 [Morchella importuna]KAH8153557.1 hypothetical protein LAJ45_02370 [Morchella importuna]
MNSPKASLSKGDTSSAYGSPTFNLNMSIKVDAPVGSMSISPSSRDVVLASQLGLHIVDLDNPYDPPRFLPHLTAWSVADVQWSPHASHSHWVVSTSNQKAIVWNLALPSRKAIELVLHSHTRAITDINFSAHQPNVLATCSIDSFVHCWDLRTPRRPVMSFCDWFAGATQVKYNRQNEHILASSHDRYLYIWDDRMGMRAVRKISAHSTKIYGVDWNRTRPSGIVTCALDRTVKFWDYDQCPDDTPERIIHTSFPVWRARHTPFGRGLLTMPQRDDTSLYLWDRRAKTDEPATPVHKFSDHTDYVKEFLWRWRGGERDDTGDDREFQLVTWSLDKDIRLWTIDQEITEKIGHDPKKKMRFRVTRRGAEYKTFRDEAAIVKVVGGKKGSAPIPMGMRHLPRLSIGGMDIEKEALKGGWRDSLFPGQNQGIRSGLVSPQSGGSLGKQLSMGSLSGDSLGLTRGNMKQGGFMRAGKRRRKEVNPITWMRGVKIARKIPVNGSESDGIRSSTGRSGLFGIGWEIPETLGDEISLVGSKFPKINFEKVNIAARSCTVSLTGPWGADNKWVFLRADISFPHEYPGDGSSLPSFILEKTNMIPEKTFDEICMQLKRISQAHVGKKRVCLEPCLCYLLGERAEDAAWVGDSDDAGESSSDDGEGIATLGARDGEEEENVGVVNTNNQANVPLPKVCGATWANDGRLICFFPPKEERFGTRSLLSSLAVRDDERSIRYGSSGRPWETFGRLYTASPIGRRATMASEAGEDTTDSTYSTTSSSSSDDDSDSIADGPLRPSLGWRLHRNIERRFRGGSTDRSTQRSTGTGAKTITGNFAKPKNIVSIHHMQTWLPAKKELAQDYQVYGDSAEVCQFNAGVAEKHGNSELADVWRLVEMVLRNEVPLEVYQHPGLSSGTGVYEDRILVVAKRASLVRGRRDSGLGLDMSDDEADDLIESEFWGRVKWGSHPLGGRWLVEELFAYFEKMADVQMLAMLSCAFCETEEPSGSDDGGLRAPFDELSLSTRTSAYARDYFPSIEMALMAHSSNNSISPNYASATLTPIGTHGSYSSTGTVHFGSDPAYPYSTGTTPPLQGFRLGTGDDAFHSLSSSPELHHHSRKSNSGMAANLRMAFGSGHSGSPPGTRRKMPSPAENLTETSSDFGEPSPIRITMMNQDKFDDEGNVHVPFLDPQKFRLYQSYRENYADLLFNWGLQTPRLEVLKYNGLKNAAFEALEEEPVGFSRKPTKVTEPSGQYFKGLELGGHCFKCGAMLISTKGARGECKPCKRRQVTMNCCVCDVIIKGLYVPCLQCGHVGHADCQEAWFSEDGVVECPTGCGCQCASFVEGGFRFTNLPTVKPLREDRVHVRRDIRYDNDYYDSYTF